MFCFVFLNLELGLSEILICLSSVAFICIMGHIMKVILYIACLGDKFSKLYNTVTTGMNS